MNWLPGADDGVVGEQLVLEVPGSLQDVHTPLTSEPRTYWEHQGPGVWVPVTVRVRYGPAPRPGDTGPVFPHLATGPKPPRNVLVERPDGSSDVRPVRLLRTRPPS